MGPCKSHLFQQGQVQGAALGLKQSQAQIQAGKEWIEQPWEKDLGGMGGAEAQCDLAMCACSPEIQTNPGMHQKQYDNWVEEGDSLPLFCSSETPDGVLRPALGPPAEEGHGPAGVSAEESGEDCQRVG